MNEIGNIEGIVKACGNRDCFVRQDARLALEKIGKPAVEPLIKALLWTEKPFDRWNAAEILGNIRDARAVEPLVQALRDENPVVRWKASEALAKIGKSALEPLMRVLKDDNKDTRWCAILALIYIGDASAVPPLIQALKREDSHIQGKAAKVLCAIAGVKAARAFISALKDDEPHISEYAGSLENIEIPAAQALFHA